MKRPKVTDAQVTEILNMTIETLYPAFDEWVRKTKGFATIGVTPEGLKLWYEYLGLVMGGKDD